MRAYPITILHLSDTRFGEHHAFNGHEYDNLAVRLIDDLQLLANDYQLRPEIVVITGDLTQSGKKSEFDQCLDFLEQLVEHLDIASDRVVLIPGNCDVNQDACAAYFSQCKAEETEPVLPYWPKWQFYEKFFKRFYRDNPEITFTKDEWHLIKPKAFCHALVF